jgi:hypothetical protein
MPTAALLLPLFRTNAFGPKAALKYPVSFFQSARQPLSGDSTGVSNTAVGASALFNNTGGNFNNAIGESATGNYGFV